MEIKKKLVNENEKCNVSQPSDSSQNSILLFLHYLAQRFIYKY